MTKLLKKILLLLPIPAVVFATTWMVDPASIKNDGNYETGVAALLLSGKNVANLVNYNERNLQKKIIHGLSIAPEVVVLGSSRCLPIDSGFFPGHLFLNSFVSGASLEDYLGVFDMYRKRELKPKLVIIGLDPWVLNRNNGQKRWKDLNDEYIEMKSILGFSTTHLWRIKENILNRMVKYKEFFSPAYFVKSSIDLIKKGSAGKKYWATDKLQAEEPIKRADGSYDYGKKVREKKIADINIDARIFIMTKPLSYLGEFTELDQSTMQLLDCFTDYLRKNDINVMFFLPPYHPTVYDVIKANPSYAMVAESEKWYRYLADKYKIKIIGSYDPKALSLEESDFYDGMHPNKQAIYLIFGSIKKSGSFVDVSPATRRNENLIFPRMTDNTK
jgi:hypothetical protein